MSGLDIFKICSVMTLQTPFSVCLPPPLNICELLFHFIANMKQQIHLNKNIFNRFSACRKHRLSKIVKQGV